MYIIWLSLQKLFNDGVYIEWFVAYHLKRPKVFSLAFYLLNKEKKEKKALILMYIKMYTYRKRPKIEGCRNEQYAQDMTLPFYIQNFGHGG